MEKNYWSVVCGVEGANAGRCLPVPTEDLLPVFDYRPEDHKVYYRYGESIVEIVYDFGKITGKQIDKFWAIFRAGQKHPEA